MGKKERIKRLKSARKAKRKMNIQVERAALEQALVSESEVLLKSKLSPGDEIRENQGKIKYSELLTDFVTPVLHPGMNLEEIRFIYHLGVMSWNLVVHIQLDKQDKILFETEKLVYSLDAANQLIFKYLMDRKKEYFEAFDILFDRFEIVERNGEFAVSTAVIVKEKRNLFKNLFRIKR